MAKKSTPAATAAVAATATQAPLFNIEVSDAPPARQSGFGDKAREPSKYTAYLEAMSAPANGKYHSFLVPVELTGEAAALQGEERTKALKAAARSTQNGISSVTRRLVKQDASRNYAMRVVTEGDKYGVRVWRVEPKPAVAEKPAPAAPAVPAAAPAVPAPAAPAVPSVPGVPQVPSL